MKCQMVCRPGYLEGQYRLLRKRIADFNSHLVTWDRWERDFWLDLDKRSGGSLSSLVDIRQRKEESGRLADLKVGKFPREALFADLNLLCLIYLKAIREQRKDIRDLMASNWKILYLMWPPYLRELVDLFSWNSDTKWLCLALAAISIEDNRTDFCDNYMALGDLYIAATRAGIDALPYFRAIGEISNARGAGAHRSHGFSTRAMLMTFKTSAFFLADVSPKLTQIASQSAI